MRKLLTLVSCLSLFFTFAISCGSGGGEAVCGNGKIETGEACDLGGKNSDTGACTQQCQEAACGDGFIYQGFEDCEDGNSNSGDGCSASCQIEFKPQMIGEIGHANNVYSADLDGDGRPDVLATTFLDGKLVWYQNNGDGTFSAEKIISNTSAGGIFASDLDGDGHLDVLFASSGDNKVAWHKNNGDSTFGPESIISMAEGSPVGIYSIDLDDDGHPDVISASSSQGKKRIAWYRITVTAHLVLAKLSQINRMVS